MASAFRVSQTMGTTLRPDACASAAAAACNGPSVRAQMAMSQPSIASWRAIARPMPRLAPVMMAFLSVSCRSTGFSFACALVRGRPLANLKERVLPIAGVGPDLAGPAAQFDGLGPCRADQYVRSLDLIDGAIPWPRVHDLLLRAADAHGEGFALDTGDSVYAGHRE